MFIQRVLPPGKCLAGRGERPHQVRLRKSHLCDEGFTGHYVARVIHQLTSFFLVVSSALHALSFSLDSPIISIQAPARAEYVREELCMDKKFDPEKIALAIVASSSYQLSVSEKIQLYMDAYDEACEFLHSTEDEDS